MSTWKITANNAPVRGEKYRGSVDPSDTSNQKPYRNIEITSLEIVQDGDVDCDPYNSTGQYCVVDIEKF